MKHTRTLLLPAHLTGLTTIAFRALKKDNSSARGAAKAYRRLEAPLFVGVGEGTDSLDFHADLSALKAILPDEMPERPSNSRPVPRSNSPLLQKLKQGEATYAYCAWCPAALPTRNKLEEHYFTAHHVLQPSCCAPPSVFQTIMGKELQMDPEEAREILGAMCSMTEDKIRVWHVKMPDFSQATLRTPDLTSPALHWLDDEEADLNDYLKDPTEPVLCVPGPDNQLYWQIKIQSRESMYGEPGSTRNYWQLSMYSERLTLGMKMHSTAAFLSMPNADGIVLGGTTDRGFNDNSARGCPAWLTLTTRQVTDVVMNDQEILSVKRGRQVSEPEPYLDDVTRSERICQICASKYLYGYPDFKVIDPIKENYPACTMPLAATSPTVVTPEILCNTQYVHDYVTHVALIREMLGQASLSVNPAVLERCSNKLLQSLCGLLKGASNCQHTREPFPAWNIVQMVRTKPTAELVNNTISLMSHDEEAHLNMPCAPMPGGLIPHLSRKGFFWKSTRPAIHETVLQYQLHLDPTDSTHLSQVEKIPCGWVPQLSKISDYNPNTGLHKSLAIDCVQGTSQYWVTKDGTTAKAASPAGPPSWSGAVQGLTQHFEQMSMRGGTHVSEMGSFLDEASDPPEKVQLNHEEVSWEYYTGHCFSNQELVPGVDRHHGTRLKLNRQQASIT